MENTNTNLKHRPVLYNILHQQISQGSSMISLKHLYRGMTVNEQGRTKLYLVNQNKREVAQMERFLAADRLVSKSGMAVKARIAQQIVEGVDYENTPDEALLESLGKQIENRSWVDAIATMNILWHRDWSHHLGRDFLIEGNEPEHAQPTGL